MVRNFTSRGNGVGLFEVAVLRGGQLWYESEITDDVIGSLTIDEVALVLADIESLDDRGRIPEPETHSIKGNPYLQFGDYKPTDGVETWKGHTLIWFQYDYDFPNGYGVSVWSKSNKTGTYGIDIYEYNWYRKKTYRTTNYRDQKQDLNYRQVEMYMDRIAGLAKREYIK